MRRILKNFMPGFVAFSTKKINRLVIFAVVFFITSGTLLYWIIGDRSEKNFIRQTLQRKQIITRSGATSMESFINLVGKALLILDDQISADRQDSQLILDEFIDEWKDTPVSGVIVTDADGIIKFNSNKYGPSVIGESVSDRKYFEWAKDAGFDEVYIGNPVKPRFGALENQYVVTITTPEQENGEFSGVINIAVLLSELTESYITPLKTSDANMFYLVSEDGTILYGPNEELIGVNYIDYLTKNDFPDSALAKEVLSEAAERMKDGTLVLTLPEAKTGKLNRFLIAYSPVKMVRSHWTLVVVMADDNLNEAYLPFRINQVIVLIFLVATILSFSAFLLVSVRVTRKKAYLKGLNHAKKYKH